MNTLVSPSIFALRFEANTRCRAVGREHREAVERLVERHLLEPGAVDVDQEDVEVALLRDP